MSSKKLSAGDFVDARCTRCRMVTNHTIVAMVEDQVVRVQCNTCNGVHNYHRPTPARAPASAGKTGKAAASAGKPRRASAGPSAEQLEWQAACRDADSARAARYEMGGSYRVDELIAHPVFGLGVVKALSKPNKMEVLFEQGKKVLRCSL